MNTKKSMIQKGLGWGNLTKSEVQHEIAVGNLVEIYPTSWQDISLKIPMVAVIMREGARSIEKDYIACNTLKLRKFYHEFSEKPPSLYYEVIKGYTCIDELKHNYPHEWKTAEDKVLQIEINSKNVFITLSIHLCACVPSRGTGYCTRGISSHDPISIIPPTSTL